MKRQAPYIHHKKKFRPFELAIKAGITPMTQAIIKYSM